MNSQTSIPPHQMAGNVPIRRNYASTAFGRALSSLRSLCSSLRRTLYSKFQKYCICCHQIPELPALEANEFSTISVVAISDSHSLHSTLPDAWPVADIFLHAGDLTQYGTKEELQSAIQWLGSLPFSHKVVIAGNHDIGLDKGCTHRSGLARRAGKYASFEETDALIATMAQYNITYLSPQNPSVELAIKGCSMKIYGSPFSPLTIGPSAFMRPRNEDTWAEVGLGSHYDILLSHSPPRSYLDQNRSVSILDAIIFCQLSNGQSPQLPYSDISMKHGDPTFSRGMTAEQQSCTMSQ